MHDVAEEAWRGKFAAESFSLACHIFELLWLRKCSLEPGASEREEPEVEPSVASIPGADLDSVLSGLLDDVCAAEVCGVMSFETGPQHLGFSSDGVGTDATSGEARATIGMASGDLCRNEFLQALHEVYDVIGRRAFNVFLRAELQKLLQDPWQQPKVAVWDVNGFCGDDFFAMNGVSRPTFLARRWSAASNGSRLSTSDLEVGFVPPASLDCSALESDLVSEGSSSSVFAAPWDPSKSPRTLRSPSRQQLMGELARIGELADSLPTSPVLSLADLPVDEEPTARRGASFLVNRLSTATSVSDLVGLELHRPPADTESGSEADGIGGSERSSVLTSLSHIYRWNQPEETLIIFDWDDTLCPTTFIKGQRWLDQAEEPPMSVKEAIHWAKPAGMSDATAAALRKHVEITSTVLRTASACGRLAIITLARPDWVQDCLRDFLPGLAEVIEELDIEITYARSSLPKWKLRSAVCDGLDIFQLMKEGAMRKCIRRTYSRRPHQSWKNIISIGDSLTERDALVEVVYRNIQRDSRNVEKTCRCKTVKLHEEPDLTQLTTELETIVNWLSPIVRFHDDLDIDLANSEATMPKLERILNGESHSVTSPVGSLKLDAIGAWAQPGHLDDWKDMRLVGFPVGLPVGPCSFRN